MRVLSSRPSLTLNWARGCTSTAAAPSAWSRSLRSVTGDLGVARGQQLEFRRKRGLDAAMLGFQFAEQLAGLFGIGAPRRGLHLVAIAAEDRRADVGAAGFQRMGG